MPSTKRQILLSRSWRQTSPFGGLQEACLESGAAKAEQVSSSSSCMEHVELGTLPASHGTSLAPRSIAEQGKGQAPREKLCTALAPGEAKDPAA